MEISRRLRKSFLKRQVPDVPCARHAVGAERDTRAHVDDAEKKREDAEKAALCAEDAVETAGNAETAGNVPSTPPSMSRWRRSQFTWRSESKILRGAGSLWGEAQQKLNAVEWERPQIIEKVARVTKSAIKEGMADALMLGQRQVPPIVKFQKIVEMSQVQFIDKDDDLLTQDFGQSSVR